MKSRHHEFDLLAKITDIRSIRRNRHKDIPRLLTYLTDSSPAVVNAARESLFAIVPMASLTERWADDSIVLKRRNPKIPNWLWNLCKGWGEPGDFADMSVQKICSLSTKKRRLLLNQLAAFQGFERVFVQRLKQINLSALAESFQKKVKLLRKRQFPKQLTISPTLTCQLSCSYCVSAGVKTEHENEISLPNIIKIINWAQKNGVKRIGLSGGEPTLYRHFLHLLKKITERGFEIYLATNGLGSTKTMQAIADARPLCVTMHLTPQVLTSESIKTFKRNASILIDKGIYAVLRCNFFDPTDTVIPYFDVTAETGMREIRAAIPIPNANRYNRYIKKVSLQEFGNLLSTFVAEGKRRGVITKLAKPFLTCKLSYETAQTFFSNGSMSTNCPVHFLDFSNNLTVYPDGSFIPCLGVSLKSQTNILACRDTLAAARIFKNRLIKLMKKPIFKECRDCPLGKGGRCLGACLSYRLTSNNDGCRSVGV